jgi:hypothetical protein
MPPAEQHLGADNSLFAIDLGLQAKPQIVPLNGAAHFALQRHAVFHLGLHGGPKKRTTLRSAALA